MLSVSSNSCLTATMNVFLLLTCAILAEAQYGRSAREEGDRIIGGEPVDIENAPFTVSLFNQPPGSDFATLCGGSILSETVVLTAGHCVAGATTDSLTVRAGSNEYGDGGTVHDVTELLAHPQYNAVSIDYDIGLIFLDPPLQLDDTRQAITLSSARPDEGDLMTVYGWGLTSPTGTLPSEVLRTVSVPVSNREECIEAYKNGRTPITERMFCQQAEGKDHCKGDSGGPIVNEDGVLAGVVSFGRNCSLPGFPGVNADINNDEIREFIESNAGISFK